MIEGTVNAAYEAVVWLSEKVGDRFKLGLVLTTGTHISNIRSDTSDRIWAAPISVLWH